MKTNSQRKSHLENLLGCKIKIWTLLIDGQYEAGVDYTTTDGTPILDDDSQPDVWLFGLRDHGYGRTKIYTSRVLDEIEKAQAD